MIYKFNPFFCLAKGRPVKADENVAVVTLDQLRSIRQETEAHPTRKAATLGQSDIERMKASTKIETAADVKDQKVIA